MFREEINNRQERATTVMNLGEAVENAMKRKKMVKSSVKRGVIDEFVSSVCKDKIFVKIRYFVEVHVTRNLYFIFCCLHV